MFRARPAPDNTLEAYDLTTLARRDGWTSPVVPTLADLEVVGTRVFLAASTVGGQSVPQPAALTLTTGAVDATWQPPPLAKRTPDPSGTPYVPALTALASDGQRLYFSGDFERVAGTDRDGIAALSVTTGGLDPWDPTPLVVRAARVHDRRPVDDPAVERGPGDPALPGRGRSGHRRGPAMESQRQRPRPEAQRHAGVGGGRRRPVRLFRQRHHR